MVKKKRRHRIKKAEAIQNFLSNLFVLGEKEDHYLVGVMNPNNRKYPRPVKG